jgi:hypothetical protein
MPIPRPLPDAVHAGRLNGEPSCHRVWTHIYITPLNGSGIDTALLALPANDGYAFTTMRALGRTGVSELTFLVSQISRQSGGLPTG